MAYRRAIAVGGEVVEVDVHLEEPGKVTVRGQAEPFDVRRVGAGEYIVANGGRSWRIWISGSGEWRQVFVDGQALEVDLARSGGRMRGGSAPRGHGEPAVAPMPATVVEIVVEVGQEVRRGDVLLKLEAMKMEMPLRAPHDGRVAAIRCKPGELVQPGAPLVELDGSHAPEK